MVASLRDNPVRSCAQYTSVELSAHVTDGDRVDGIGVGELSNDGTPEATMVDGRSITASSRSARALVSSTRLWAGLSLLKTSLPRLLEGDYLAQALAYLNYAAHAGWSDAKASTLRMQGLVRIHVDARRPGNTPIGITAIVDEDAFAGQGDLDLFGERLVDLLRSKLDARHALRLRLVNTKRALVFEYKPMAGTNMGGLK